MARGRSEKVLSRRYDGDSLRRTPDEVVVEEPMAIHLDDTLVATTMRTPGHDFELAVGFCHTEGLLGGAPVESCRYCATGSAVETGFNVVSVDTGGRAPEPTPRLGPATSSCGLCGTADLDEVMVRLDPIPTIAVPPLEVCLAAPDRLRRAQGLFDTTGSVHAAAAFDAAGELLVVREDIGRHNAVDKVVGRLLLDARLPAAGLGLVVSGRASFEMVQKAWAAGFGVLVSVSGPSSLAVEAAQRAGLVLLAFARDGHGTLYAPTDGDPFALAAKVANESIEAAG